MLLPLTAAAQKKVYTRKMKMEDFAARSTRVVLTGNASLDDAIQESVFTRWTVSPYEFCTPVEYGKIRENADFYFLSVENVKDLMYLVLAKGGKQSDKDPLKQPFEVLRMPVARADSSAFASTFMPAYVDIIQNYVEDVLVSDAMTYGGLNNYERRIPRSRKVVIDLEAAAEALEQGRDDIAIGLSIGRYYMIFAADTHELYQFGRGKDLKYLYGKSR